MIQEKLSIALATLPGENLIEPTKEAGFIKGALTATVGTLDEGEKVSEGLRSLASQVRTTKNGDHSDER